LTGFLGIVARRGGIVAHDHFQHGKTVLWLVAKQTDEFLLAAEISVVADHDVSHLSEL
jgi:hypothetical protein